MLVRIRQGQDDYARCGNPRVADPFGNTLARLEPTQTGPYEFTYGYAGMAAVGGDYSVVFDATECAVRRTDSEAAVLWDVPDPAQPGLPTIAIEALSHLPLDVYESAGSLWVLDHQAARRLGGAGCGSAVVPLTEIPTDAIEWCALGDGIVAVEAALDDLDQTDVRHALSDARYEVGEYGTFELWRLPQSGRAVGFVGSVVLVGVEERVKLAIRAQRESGLMAANAERLEPVLTSLSPGFAYRFTSRIDYPGGWSWYAADDAFIEHRSGFTSFADATEAANIADELNTRFAFDGFEAAHEGRNLFVQRRELFRELAVAPAAGAIRELALSLDPYRD